ncbi:MAG: hypothetical protein KatS3mg126_0960 [Lysobacteraceae bacterium]|nr:MAG: hypothetical protein KatS3mg126_0960 [Xanthomonadaceae bacterium]
MDAPPLLRELRTRALPRLRELAGLLLDQADDALFDLAQGSRGGREQQDHLDAMRRLRTLRGALVEAMPGRIADALLESPPPLRPAGAEDAAPALEAGSLELVGLDDLEEQLARERLAQTVERRLAGPLQRLGAALGRIWEREPVPAEDLPLGPLRIGRELGRELQAAELPLASRLVVYKLLERLLLSEFGALLEDCNGFLAERGIAEAAAPARPAATRIGPPRPGGPGRPETGQAAQEDAEAEHEPRQEAGHEASAQAQAEAWLAALRELFTSYLGGEAPHSASVARGADAAATGSPAPAPAAVHWLSLEQLTGLLRPFQSELPEAIRQAALERQQALGGLLRRALLDAARQQDPEASLQASHEQALTLVGMLFDVLLDQGRFSEEQRLLLTRMLPAYAQIALRDPQLFAQRNHPARRLLNELTEALEGNRGSSRAEQELRLRVTAVVDRIARDYRGDLGLIEELEQRFSALLERQKQRAALAERRTTETQRGRERLEEARTLASLEVAALTMGRHLPPPFDAFIHRDWGHHLTVTLLRAGEQSEDYTEARRIGPLLWQAVETCTQGGPIPDGLEAALRAVDASCGRHHADEVLAALARLHRSTSPAPTAVEPTAPAPLPPPPADLAADRTAPPPVGFEVETRVGPRPELPTGDIDLVIEQEPVPPEALERARALQQGSWVDLVDASGQPQPAKLSWISPISQRMLFVNRQGARLCLLSPAECAALIQQGKLVPRTAVEAFDRAMVGLLDRLRNERRP